jgi:predicted hotdog family 3-hydroxylacyl-ACP dehydratase
MTNVNTLQNAERFSGTDAALLLYHEEPMVLLDRVVSVTADSACCTCRSGAENPFFIPGLGIPPWVSIEFMAQCVAVNAGARATSAGKLPPLGLLLGTRSLQMEAGYIRPDQDCRVESLTILSDDQGMSAHQCQLLVNGKVVAQARLTAKEIERGNDSVGLIIR